MVNNHPQVSIVTVAYNAVHCIEPTILSVLNQSYTDFEFLIIDGGSKDGTVDIIKQYVDHLAFFSSEPDNGIYDGMNKAIAQARGKWILFMNCGDVFYDKNVLMSCKAFFDLNSVGVLYGNTLYVSTIGDYLVSPEPLSAFDTHMPFCHQSVFVRLDLARKHPFNLDFRFVADYDMFYNLYRNGIEFRYINLPIARYDNTKGFTASNRIACKLETYRINKKNISFLTFFVSKIHALFLTFLPLCVTNIIRKYKYGKNSRFQKV